MSPICGANVYPEVIATACPQCHAGAGQRCKISQDQIDRLYDPFHFVHMARYESWSRPSSPGAPTPNGGMNEQAN